MGLSGGECFPALTELDPAIEPYLAQSFGTDAAFFLLHAENLAEKAAVPVQIPDGIGRVIDISCHIQHSFSVGIEIRRSGRGGAVFLTIARRSKRTQ